MYRNMSNITLLLLGFQAYLIQIVHSQCPDLTQTYTNIGLPNSLIVEYGCGNNNILGYNNVGVGFNAGGLGYQVYAPTFAPGFTYGGIGSGLLKVIGKLPVVGTTIVGGHVPIIGAVQFTGKLPAVGRVVITGSCGCGCGCNVPHVY